MNYLPCDDVGATDLDIVEHMVDATVNSTQSNIQLPQRRTFLIDNQGHSMPSPSHVSS